MRSTCTRDLEQLEHCSFGQSSRKSWLHSIGVLGSMTKAARQSCSCIAIHSQGVGSTEAAIIGNRQQLGARRYVGEEGGG